MWDVFFQTEFQNSYKTWETLLHKPIFPLKKSKIQCQEPPDTVQEMTWSVLYPMSNLANVILHKVLTMVLLTATVQELCAVTMIIFLYNLYDALEETLNNVKSLLQSII